MRWIIAVLLLLLAACHPPPTNDENATNTDPNLVQWDRSPQTVIFRADVIGGDSAFLARNAVPNCTIYGDNRMVWVNELGPFQIEVLEDRLPDGAISAFIQYLTVNERIYTFEAGMPTVQAQSFGLKPVVETVLVNVSGAEHHADSLSDWDDQWFSRVLDACKRLAQAPVLVQPTGGWLAAQPVSYDMQKPLVIWDADVPLADAPADAPLWFSGDKAAQLWTTLHSLPSNVIFQDGDAYYEVALQVPGITRDAPPAPEGSA